MQIYFQIGVRTKKIKFFLCIRIFNQFVILKEKSDRILKISLYIYKESKISPVLGDY